MSRPGEGACSPSDARLDASRIPTTSTSVSIGTPFSLRAYSSSIERHVWANPFRSRPRSRCSNSPPYDFETVVRQRSVAHVYAQCATPVGRNYYRLRVWGLQRDLLGERKRSRSWRVRRTKTPTMISLAPTQWKTLQRTLASSRSVDMMVCRPRVATIAPIAPIAPIGGSSVSRVGGGLVSGESVVFARGHLGGVRGIRGVRGVRGVNTTTRASNTSNPSFALLFDCDGVLVETEELHRLAYNASFQYVLTSLHR